MIGNTGTCYRRGKAAWKGMLILSAARGGRVNTYYGDLSLLDDGDGAWFAKAQALYFPLQAAGKTSLFGDDPGSGKPYGFVGRGPGGAVCTVLNPGAIDADIPLPIPRDQGARILFTDAGRAPGLGQGVLRLRARAADCVVGSGNLCGHPMGPRDWPDVVIPAALRALLLADVVHCRGCCVSTTVLAQARVHYASCAARSAPTAAHGVSREGRPPPGSQWGNSLSCGSSRMEGS